MAELVGVIDSMNAIQPLVLKRTALLFDRIAVPVTEDNTVEYWYKQNVLDAKDLLWLINEGIAYEVKAPPKASIILNADDEREVNLVGEEIKEAFRLLLGHDVVLESPIGEIESTLKRRFQDPNVNDTEKLKALGHFIEVGEGMSRVFGCLLRSTGVKAYPVLSFNLRKTIRSSPSDAIEIVFDNLPTPDSKTPWEQILEYRADPESRAKFLDLRNWINEISRQKLPPVELSEKLEYLLSQYERHMRLHKMKMNTGVIESVVVGGGELVENLLKLKLGKLAQSVFSIKQRKIALLEGELKSPGSEVAYILKTKSTFSK
jgi:hypothetical protein